MEVIVNGEKMNWTEASKFIIAIGRPDIVARINENAYELGQHNAIIEIDSHFKGTQILATIKIKDIPDDLCFKIDPIP